jgi:hypothetical protein
MKKLLLWLLAVVMTLGSAIYQRRTGPTHPFRGEVKIGDTQVSYRLLRSFPMPFDAPIRVTVENRDVKGFYRFKRYPSHDEWQERQMEREDNMLVAYIPRQPAAGKIKYQIYLQKDLETVALSEEPLVIRFRDSVPAWAMIPHILFMFVAMLLSTRAGLASLGRERTFGLTLWTFVTLVIGGLILGPIVQKYAFGDYWTGWPFGTDLTDNKTAVAFIFWLIALIMAWKKPYHRTWVLVASVVLLVVYLIPHSLLGSEIDWTEEGAEEIYQTAGLVTRGYLPGALGFF